MSFAIPKLQLRHKSALIYYEHQRIHSQAFYSFRIGNMLQQRLHRYSGKLTAGGKKRLTKAVTILTTCIKPQFIYNEVSKRYHWHKLSFVTLTVSDHQKKLTGKTAYRLLLSHFLQWLRRTHNVRTYIWKAELQKNGQIHYHITTPAFIHYQKVRDVWNNLQRKAGLLDKYAQEHGHYNANSTDIHEVKGVNDLAAYLIKYIAKSYQNAEDLGGKVWDCSENLSAAKYFVIDLKPHHKLFFDLAEENDLARLHIDERFTIVKFKEPPAEYLLTKEELKAYTHHIYEIRKTLF